MSGRPVLGLLHPGRMGAAVAAQARRGGYDVLWVPAGRSRATAARADAAGLTAVESLPQFLGQAQLVVAVCPPAVAEAVAQSVAGHGFIGTYLEANAISPLRVTAIRRMLGEAGATVVDGSIFGPPPTSEVPARLYLAGPTLAVDLITGVFEGTAVNTTALVQPPPAASALKLAYASYQKATRTLAAVAHALAAEYDVTDHLLIEGLHNSNSPLTSPDYLPSVAVRAWRWAPEMLDAATTLTDAGLPDELALATAQVLNRWSHRKDDDDLTLADTLDDLHHRQRPQTP